MHHNIRFRCDFQYLTAEQCPPDEPPTDGNYIDRSGLPTEMLRLIFEHCVDSCEDIFPELMRLSQVCQKWCQIIYDSRSLWRKFVMVLSPWNRIVLIPDDEWLYTWHITMRYETLMLLIDISNVRILMASTNREEGKEWLRENRAKYDICRVGITPGSKKYNEGDVKLFEEGLDGFKSHQLWLEKHPEEKKSFEEMHCCREYFHYFGDPSKKYWINDGYEERYPC